MFDSAAVFSRGISIRGPAASKLMLLIGQAIAEAARRNARAKGGRSFWRSVADSVNVQQYMLGDGGRMVIGATHVAAAQKQFGGPISAPGKGRGALGASLLTIPLGEARRRRWTTRDARRFYNLFRPKNSEVLFGTPVSGATGPAVPLFALKKTVHQQPDPWFPSGDELTVIIRRAIALWNRIHPEEPASESWIQ